MVRVVTDNPLVRPGDAYGHCTVIGECFRGPRFKQFVVVECECGSISVTRAEYLKSGKTTSCGCVKRSQCPGTVTHGLRDHPLVQVWRAMRLRCTSSKCKSFKNYGGRGISVCADWSSDPLAFHEWALTAGWQPGLELDRIDNDGNYEPSNCRFVTKRENNCNKRSGNWKLEAVE